jgi:hypothetical protein
VTSSLNIVIIFLSETTRIYTFHLRIQSHKGSSPYINDYNIAAKKKRLFWSWQITGKWNKLKRLWKKIFLVKQKSMYIYYWKFSLLAGFGLATFFSFAFSSSGQGLSRIILSVSILLTRCQVSGLSPPSFPPFL